MLYVSQIISRWKVVVVDTDDGVATEADIRDLRNYIYDGIVPEIKGISFDDDNVYSRVAIPSDQLTRKDLKLAVLDGVKLIEYGGVLSGIQVVRKLSGDVRIVLSDYVNEIANHLFKNAKGLADLGYNVILVLDDKVKINRFSFCEAKGCTSIVYDLSLVSDINVAELVYKYLYDWYRGTFFSRQRIIDNNRDRYIKFIGLSFVQSAENATFYSRINIRSYIQSDNEFNTVKSFIIKKYTDEFNKLVRTRFKNPDADTKARMDYLLRIDGRYKYTGLCEAFKVNAKSYQRLRNCVATFAIFGSLQVDFEKRLISEAKKLVDGRL